jgi:para-nitrobenzyl esterase
VQAGQCWTTAHLNATTFRSVCFQSPKQAYVKSESEDCLHLTVWQPHSVARNESAVADVIVFFHGGDLTFGSANFYDMSLLAADGSVVVVSVNYRLNFFGFLATSELTTFDRRNSSGNLGLLDMQESLRWVRRNIKHVSMHCRF